VSKQIDYPRASLKNSLELASAVDSLGGSCSIEMAAEKSNKKVSGAFQALAGSAVRYGLLSAKKGTFEVTPLYRDFKLAYDDAESRKVLTNAFLSPSLFKRIYDRFKDRELPISHFEKLLIREFGIPDQISSRVSKYFTDGAKQCGLLGPDNKLLPLAFNLKSTDENTLNSDDAEVENLFDDQDKLTKNISENSDSNAFSVRIKGPGMDSVIEINDVEDILIVKAMLKKVEKRISQSDEITSDYE
jgi:hypothetical protein